MRNYFLFSAFLFLSMTGCTRTIDSSRISPPPLGTQVTTPVADDLSASAGSEETPFRFTSTHAAQPTKPKIQKTDTVISKTTKTILKTPSETVTFAQTGTPPPTPTTKLPGGVPVKEWKDIPIMPDAVAGEDNTDRYRFMLMSTVDQVEKFYKTELTRLGWKFETKGTGENGAPIFIFSKSGKVLSISVIVIGDLVVVSLAPI